MFRKELGKMMTNAVFYLAVAAMVIILMSGTFFTSPNTGRQYTFYDIIFSEDRDSLMAESYLRSSDVIIQGTDSYADMFLPIIAAMPFVMLVCGEKKNSSTRFEIYRIGKTKYVLGKYFAAMAAGGFIAAAGYIIFSIIISVLIPGGDGVVIEYQKEYILDGSMAAGWLYNTLGTKGLYLLKYIRMFFYGTFAVVPAFGMSAVTKNRYIILSVPFLIIYLLNKFTENATDPKVMYLLPKTIGNVFMTDFLRLVVIFGSITVLVLVFYRIFTGRKCDCGED